MLTHREIRVTDRVSYDYVRITFSFQEIFYILDMFGFFLKNVNVFEKTIAKAMIMSRGEKTRQRMKSCPQLKVFESVITANVSF